MAKIHTLTYNGTKSSDLGVFVSGSGSFDAAEFDVDKYEIPGRNGDLILSNNRYKNIEITYPAFIPKAFMDKVQNVRNWLRSSKVYARLEDTYDLDHYRLGIPTGVQSFSPENRNDGANFEMTFDCKPQRFLKVGETPETVEADVQTETGDIVTFETVAESPITSASVSLSPIQSLNGYDSPWPGGGGKNLLDPDDFEIGKYITAAGLVASGPTNICCVEFVLLKANNTYVVSAGQIINNIGVCIYNTDKSTVISRTNNYNKASVIIESSAADRYVRVWFDYNGSPADATYYDKILPQLESGSSATSYAPYSNICPISGHTGAELNIAAEYDAEDKTTYSVTFTDQGTVYGGTYDFVSGEGTRKVYYDRLLSTSAWDRQAIGGHNYFCTTAFKTALTTYQNLVTCTHFKVGGNAPTIGDPGDGTITNAYGRYYPLNIRFDAVETVDDFKAFLADNEVYVCIEATPQEFTLSAQQLTTLQGQNNVWGNGTITLTYAEPYNIDNPTLFDARPLFTVTNPAEGDVIMVNGQAITFVDGYTGTVYIDCETMNAFSGAANLNSIIQATDFPVLVPGTNIVTWTGAGECTMTPRWWEL